MKQKDNITLYYCDFCSKKLFRKYAMENHENRCGNNPENFTACTMCKHLERKSIDYERTPQIEGQELYRAEGFYCNKKEVFMYPPILKHKGRIPDYVEHNGKEILQECMPKECNHYEFKI